MSAHAVSGLRPGDVDAQVAGRAARRIRDHLASHPEGEPVTVSVEAGEDALAVPRPRCCSCGLAARVSGWSPIPPC
jgi:hypothetical protein